MPPEPRSPIKKRDITALSSVSYATSSGASVTVATLQVHNFGLADTMLLVGMIMLQIEFVLEANVQDMQRHLPQHACTGMRAFIGSEHRHHIRLPVSCHLFLARPSMLVTAVTKELDHTLVHVVLRSQASSEPVGSRLAGESVHFHDAYDDSYTVDNESSGASKWLTMRLGITGWQSSSKASGKAVRHLAVWLSGED